MNDSGSELLPTNRKHRKLGYKPPPSQTYTTRQSDFVKPPPVKNPRPPKVKINYAPMGRIRRALFRTEAAIAGAGAGTVAATLLKPEFMTPENVAAGLGVAIFGLVTGVITHRAFRRHEKIFTGLSHTPIGQLADKGYGSQDEIRFSGDELAANLRRKPRK